MRVERILRGDLREDDVTRLFLYARDRCDGRESVQEIGDFVAHHSKRTKGIVTKSAREWFAIIRCGSPAFLGKPLDPQRLPKDFPAFLHAMGRRLERKLIRRQTGLRQSEAVALIPGIVIKLYTNADGTYAIYPFYSPNELAVINCFLRNTVVSPAFTGDKLFNDFVATLHKHDLLKINEIDTFTKSRHFILLYAAIQMHQCSIVIDEETTARVYLTAHKDGNLQVDCGVPIKTGMWNIPLINFASALFETDLHSKDCCDEELLAAPLPWEFALEISSSGMLRRLR